MASDTGSRKDLEDMLKDMLKEKDCGQRLRVSGGYWCRDVCECEYKQYNVRMSGLCGEGGDHYFACNYWDRLWKVMSKADKRRRRESDAREDMV